MPYAPPRRALIAGRAIALAALGVCLAAPVAAQVYKWVDEKGRTHYSETPPPDGKATRVETGPAAAERALRPDDWKEKELESRRRRIEREAVEEKSRRDTARATAERLRRCRAAREDLQHLEQQVRIYHINERGERVYLEDKDRPAAIREAREAIRAYCDT